MDGRRFLRVMARFGWTVVKQRGSHRKLTHPTSPIVLIVAFHDTIGVNSIRRTLRDAGIKKEDFLAHM